MKHVCINNFLAVDVLIIHIHQTNNRRACDDKSADAKDSNRCNDNCCCGEQNCQYGRTPLFLKLFSA